MLLVTGGVVALLSVIPCAELLLTEGARREESGWLLELLNDLANIGPLLLFLLQAWCTLLLLVKLRIIDLLEKFCQATIVRLRYRCRSSLDIIMSAVNSFVFNL